jgi:hypothetical protein
VDEVMIEITINEVPKATSAVAVICVKVGKGKKSTWRASMFRFPICRQGDSMVKMM